MLPAIYQNSVKTEQEVHAVIYEQEEESLIDVEDDPNTNPCAIS